MRKWLIVLGHNHEREIARNDSYSEQRMAGNYLGKHSRQRVNPLKAGVAVAGLGLEERESCCGRKLRCVMALLSDNRVLSSGRTGCHDLLCVSRASRVLCGCNSTIRSRKEAYQHTDAMTSPQAQVAGYLGKVIRLLHPFSFRRSQAYSFLMNRRREWLLFGCLAAVLVACPRGAR